MVLVDHLLNKVLNLLRGVWVAVKNSLQTIRSDEVGRKVVSWGVTDRFETRELFLLNERVNQELKVVSVPGGNSSPKLDQAKPVLVLDAKSEGPSLILKQSFDISNGVWRFVYSQLGVTKIRLWDQAQLSRLDDELQNFVLTMRRCHVD